MSTDILIIVGDKVDLMLPPDGEVPFRTTIEDIGADGVLWASFATSEDYPSTLGFNTEVDMVYYRHTGRYIARVKTVGFQIKGKVQYVLLTQMAEPVKDQRRKYYRLPVSLNALICEYNSSAEMGELAHEEPAEAVALEIAGTRDISITGVALVTKLEYTLGGKYILKLFFEENPKEPEKPFAICAEVVRLDYEEKSSTYRIGMRFFAQTQTMSEYLARYVLKQQQKQVMRRRFIDE